MALVMKDLKDYHHVRKKFRLAFYASKIEELEEGEEDDDTKALRKQFFDVEANMQMELEAPDIPNKE